jgi:hypothetical protein
MWLYAHKDSVNVAGKDSEGETAGTHGNPGSRTRDVELNGKELVPPGYLRSLRLDGLRQQPKRSRTMLKSRAISLYLLTAELALLQVSIYSIVNLQLFACNFSFISLLMLQELLLSLQILRGLPDALCGTPKF